jgi:alkyl sulfatase BDS1-like metallo-beta-lactamase superfamily hydrolase
VTDLKELAEKAWRGELDLRVEHHPVHRHYPGWCELAPGLLGMKGIAGFYVVDTGDGLVLLDSGSVQDTQRLFDAVHQWRPGVAVVAAVYTHHHVDHVMGVFPFDEEAAQQGRPRPVVYAHESLPAHFDRYRATLGLNTAINRRQFAIDAPGFRWPERYRYPDVVFQERLTFRRGELSFELRHARGETDDISWVWIPQRRIVAAGDLVIWAVPNAGNPQKVQRYVGDWAETLERMSGLDAEILLTGHGFPVFGAGRIRQLLGDTARLLRTIEERTLALMNRGFTLDHIVHSIELPADLLQRPYLRPVYDDPSFLVRMVWRRYAGWWDGDYDTVLPAPKAEQAREWIDLAGGIEAVLARAEALATSGRLALACHLIESALRVAPGDDRVHRFRAAIYRGYSQAQSSSMGRNLLGHAALASERGRRDLSEDDGPAAGG